MSGGIKALISTPIIQAQIQSKHVTNVELNTKDWDFQTQKKSWGVLYWISCHDRFKMNINE